MKKLAEAFELSGDDKILQELLGGVIDVVENFPIDEVSFIDMTSLLKDNQAFTEVIDAMAWQTREFAPDYIVCIEARGFLFGSAVSYLTGVPLVLARKKGKLPKEQICASYKKEYGYDEIYMHADDIEPNSRVLIIDDVIATGNTAEALAELIEDKCDASKVQTLALIELVWLCKSSNLDRMSLVQIDLKK